MLNKKAFSERDICTKFITPALVTAGWDIQKQVREEWSFTDGRIIVRGHKYTKGKQKRVDYVLFYKSTMVAIVEAKDNSHSVGLLSIDSESVKAASFEAEETGVDGNKKISGAK